MNKTVTLQIRVSPPLIKRLIHHAKLRDTTVSEIVRQGIHKILRSRKA